MDGDTSYVTVKLDGESRTVLGTDFTTVKSVLEAGNITLGPNDTVDPALDAEVDESTVITIETADSTLETSEEPIAFNTVRKETSSLPEGTDRWRARARKAWMETTSLVTRGRRYGGLLQRIRFLCQEAPVDKVILVGTGSASSGSSSSSSASIGTTVPAGEMQQWAHDYLLTNGYTEADFSATVYIINHESGWRVNATNASSGAYGLPQALPGSKMASAGADWATNYQSPAQVVLGLLQQPLRLGAGRLQLLGGQPLVLIVTNEEARGFPGLLFLLPRPRPPHVHTYGFFPEVILQRVFLYCNRDMI